MTELISRMSICSLFIMTISFSIYNNYFYLLWITSLFSVSLWELAYFTKTNPSIVRVMTTLHVYTYYLLLFRLLREDVMALIIYNSSSDIFQYLFGKIFGRTKPFLFTTKSIEGYIAGLIFPHLIFNFGPIFPFLNILGMIGGMISSVMKRNMGIKHWGGMLGSHGGINDRLDSIVLPLIVYYFLEY